MTDLQKRAVHALLKLSYEHGFNGFSVNSLAEKLGVAPAELYDEDAESGALWDFHPGAMGTLAGFLWFGGRAGDYSAGVVCETRDLLAHWSDFREY